MQYVIINYIAMLRYPQLLAKHSKDFCVCVFDLMTKEIEPSHPLDRLQVSLAKAVISEGGRIINLSKEDCSQYAKYLSQKARCPIDENTARIVKSIVDFKHTLSQANQDNVVFITTRNSIRQASKVAGLKTLSVLGAKREFRSVKELNPRLQEQVKLFRRLTGAKPIFSLFLFLVLPAIFLSLLNWKSILGFFPIWFSIIGILFTGVFLFFLRCRFRLPYGLLEFAFGLAVSIRVMWPDFEWSTAGRPELIQIVAGLYIIVRSLGNIGEGLRYTALQEPWSIAFGDKWTS